jgi:hypothetical protein
VSNAGRDLVIRFLADTKDLRKAASEAEGSLGKLKSAAVVAGGALVAGFAASKVVDFLGDATKAAEEDKKSQALLANQLRETNSATDEQIASVEKHIDALARTSGVADDTLRPAYAALARSAGDTEKANEQLSVAMDIAAGRGVDLESVTKAMEKANNGNVTALGKLGIATKDAAGNTLSLDQIMANAAKTYAGAAEAAVTPSQRWSVAFGELKEQVGTALLPVLEKLATFMADVLLPAIQNAVAWVEANWPAISATVKDTVDKIVGYVQPVIETLVELWQKFGDDIFNAVKGAFDLIVGQIKTGVALIQAVVQPIVDLLHGDWGKAWDDFSKRIGQAWDGIKQQVEGAVGIVKGILGGFVSATQELPGKIAGAAVGMFKGIVDEIGKLPGQIASAAVGMFDGIWTAFRSVLNKIIGAFNSFFSHLGIHIHEGLGPLPDLNFDWDFPLRIPTVPLARGGIVTRPTLALIGEAGPEAVVPLGRGGGGTGAVNIYGPVYLQTDMSEDDVVRKFNAWARRNNGVRSSGGVTAVS